MHLLEPARSSRSSLHPCLHSYDKGRFTTSGSACHRGHHGAPAPHHLKGCCFSLSRKVCWKSRERSAAVVAGNLAGCRTGKHRSSWKYAYRRDADAMLCYALFATRRGVRPCSATAPPITPSIHRGPCANRVTVPLGLVLSDEPVARGGCFAPGGTPELYVDGTRPVREITHP